jgi:glycosyl transferase family 1
MRLFQNYGLAPAYLRRLNALARDESTFSGRLNVFLGDRFGASHLLKPVLEREPMAFFTNGDDEVLQRLWASEHGLPDPISLEEILLAQLEEHQTEIFYNIDPMRYGSDFVKKLPGCVKTTIAWRAAPSPGADFSAYDAVVCNFPSIIRQYRARGWRAEYFSPAYDPEMDSYAANTDRPTDVLFVGTYSRHHLRRARMLDSVASLRHRFDVVFCLDRSRLTRLAESPIVRVLPLNSRRRPPDTSAVTHGPVFGRDLYARMASAKIVLNGAVDMAGVDRGNMRCFEATGCGALMVSDKGDYPPGFVDHETMMLYETESEAVAVIEDALADPARSRRIAAQAHQMIGTHYSKTTQWKDFTALLGRV